MIRPLLAALAAFTPAAALAFGDPDWPCEQRKVEHLSIGQVWTLPMPADAEAWRKDDALARLAGAIAARRTGMDEVKELVAGVAAVPGADRPTRLTMLFAGVFHLIDRERARLVDGITRYALHQRALAEKIDAAQAAIDAARAQAAPGDNDALDRIEEMEDARTWDTRIYNERRASLSFVCESPVTLERRAFAIGRMIEAEIRGS